MRYQGFKMLGLVLALATGLHAQVVVYGPPLTIGVVNNSGLVSDDDAARWTAAIARQVHEDLAPVWKIDANIVLQANPPPGAWVCTLADSGTGESSATLGIHMVGSDGTPQCTVNAAKIIQAQGSISATLSHEILEMLVDPWLSTVTFLAAGSPNAATVYLHEICDPVAGYGYLIDGVTVADFVTPRFLRRRIPARGSGAGPAWDRHHDPAAHRAQLHAGPLHQHLRRHQQPGLLDVHLGKLLRLRAVLI